MRAEKDSLRKMMLKRRLEIPSFEREKWEKKILWKIIKRPEFKKAKTLALYYPVKGEVNLLHLFEISKKEKKKVFFPKVKGDSLSFINVESLDKLKPGFASIPEPEGEETALEDLELIIIPAVAFDMRGYRLGMGGGFYDDLLRKKKQSQIGIGVAFHFQILDKIPVDWWDEKVDILISEELTLMPSTSITLRRWEK